MKTIGKAGFAALVFLAVLAGCSRSPDAVSTATADEWVEAAQKLDPIAVEAVTVQWDRLVGDITASGIIRGAHEVTVVAETQGVIQDVSFNLGDAVEEGTVLVSFDDTIELLSVEEASQALASAELDVATVERLVATGNASQLQLSNARSALAGSRARLAQAEKALEDRTVEAPISGFVASVDSSIQIGNSVGRGVPVARIVDTDDLEVVLSIGEREIPYLQTGAKAFVRFTAAGNRELEGSVYAIAAGSDPATGSFSVIVRWSNNLGSAARAGMSATVRIPPVGSPWAITVPANAVRTVDGESYLFVAKDGAAVRRIVGLGGQTGDRVVVNSGLTEGEQVIVSAISSLNDETPVSTTVLAADR